VPGLRRVSGTGAKRERTVANVPVGGQPAQVVVRVRRRVCATYGYHPDANMSGGVLMDWQSGYGHRVS
jgi:hypothetical protein